MKWTSASVVLVVFAATSALAQSNVDPRQIMHEAERRCRLVPVDELERRFGQILVEAKVETSPVSTDVAVCYFDFADPGAEFDLEKRNLHITVALDSRARSASEASVTFFADQERAGGFALNLLNVEAFYNFCEFGNVPAHTRLCVSARKGRGRVNVNAFPILGEASGQTSKFKKIDNRLWRQLISLASDYAERLNLP